MLKDISFIVQNKKLHKLVKKCHYELDQIGSSTICAIIEIEMDLGKYYQPWGVVEESAVGLPTGAIYSEMMPDQTTNLSIYLRRYLNEAMTRIYLDGIKQSTLVKTGKLNVNIAWDMESFLNLGHYGVDQLSCFSNTGINRINKYSLMITENSFVITIVNELGKIEFRCIGFKSADTFYVFNLYPLSLVATVRRVLDLFFSKIMGEPYGSIDRIQIEKNTEAIYINPEPRWAFIPVLGKTYRGMFQPFNSFKYIDFGKVKVQINKANYVDEMLDEIMDLP